MVAAAAYRAGERILEERTGLVHDYRRRSGVDHREISAPRGAPGWCKCRAKLWNRAEDAERRKDAQVGRQIELALPRELSVKQRRRLVRSFVRKNFTCRGMVADTAYHDQDGENPHVHVLLTTRLLAGAGFSTKKQRAWNERECLNTWRSSWARHVNAFLRRAGCQDRVDHRTLDAQRLDAVAADDLELATKLDRVPGRHYGRAPAAIQARADRIAVVAAAQDDAIRSGEVDQPDYAHVNYNAAEYECSYRIEQILNEREQEAEDRWENREGERAVRNASRLMALFAQPGERDIYRAAVTEIGTTWRPTAGKLPELPDSPIVDRALDVAESHSDCLRRLRDLLEHTAGKNYYRGILDAHGDRFTLKDVDGAIDVERAEERWREECRAAEQEALRERARIEAERRSAEARRLAEEQRKRKERLEGIASEAGGRDLYEKKLDELDPGWRVGGEPKVAAIDTALTYAETELKRRAEVRQQVARRASRVDRVLDMAGGDAALVLALDREKVNWREAGARTHDFDRALDIAERSAAHRASATQHRLVVDAEKTFPSARSNEWWAAREAFSRHTETDERGRTVAGLLSDRARVQEIVDGGSDVLASSSVVGRLVEWLRQQVEKLLRVLHLVDRSADAAMADLPKARPRPRVHPNHWAAAVSDGALERGSDADPFVTDVYAEVGERLEREPVVIAGGSSHLDRKAAAEAYLKPLVDGELRRQERSWSASSGTPCPTLKSAGAVVVERHRKKVEEVILVACYRTAGRPASAAGLEQHRDDVRRAAEAAIAGLPGAQPRWELRPDHLVPAISGGELEPGPDTDPLVADVYAEMRDRLYREPACIAGGSSHLDRKAAAEAYLKPLVDGELRRQGRSWSASSGTPCPTLKSAGAVVVERHRKKVEEVILVACYRTAGRPASAAGLEQHRDDVRRAAEAAIAGLPGAQPRWELRPDHLVPAISGGELEPGPDTDPLVADVYAEMRDRLYREPACIAGGSSHLDRKAAAEAYLKPLVDGELRRQGRSWSASSGTPCPTLKSAGAVVVERHRKKVEEVILVACYRTAGRPASAAGLEQHRDDVRRAAEAAIADLPKTQPLPHSRPDRWVPVVSAEAVEPAVGGDPFMTDVYAEVQDRLDREAAADGYGHWDRERSEERYLEGLLEETLKQQARTSASEIESSYQRREAVRERLQREHRARLLNTVMAACLELHGDGAPVEGRSRRISGPAQIAGATSRTELLGSTANDGSPLDAGGRLVADQSRTDAVEEEVGAPQSHQASPPSVPAAKVRIVFERDNEMFRIKEETEQGTSRLLKEVHTVLEGLNWLASQGLIESESIPEREKKIEMDLSRERSR